MTRPYKVLFFGNTLLIEGVQAGLRESAEMEISQIADGLAHLREHLKTDCPDVVIFDLGMIPPEALFDSACECPAMRLIGLDPNRNAAIQVSSQLHSTLSTQDLTQIIRGG